MGSRDCVDRFLRLASFADRLRDLACHGSFSPIMRNLRTSNAPLALNPTLCSACDPKRTCGIAGTREYDRLKRPAQCATSNLETMLKHDSSVGDIKPRSNGRMVNSDLKGRRRANDSLSEPRLHRRAASRYRRVCSASDQVRSRHRLEMQPDADRDQLCARGRSVMLSNAPVSTPECRPTQDPAPRCPAFGPLGPLHLGHRGKNGAPVRM